MKLASLIMLIAASMIPVVADDVDQWIKDLKDPSPSVRGAAVDALEEFNNTQSVQPLIQALVVYANY